MADLTFDCPECAHNLVVDAQAAGLVVACPDCGTQLRVPSPDAAAGEVAAPDAAEPAPVPEMAAGATLEYKVVSMSDAAGPITADAVEFALNERMQEGWQLRSATTLQMCGAQGQPGQELLLILERPI
ncbi:MAG: hypothetical protein WCI17_07655 [bacterium]